LVGDPKRPVILITPDSPELSANRLAELTSRYVSIPSVNGEHPERDLALAVAEDLESSGFETVLVGEELRPSVGVRTPGEPKVLLNGHLDTVPVDDGAEWRFDPFSGVIADDRVHGRGACDMKGGLAIQVAVSKWLAAQEVAEGLILHFAMGEERGEPGTEDLLEAGFVAPLGLVLEPTDFQLGIAQRGLVTLRITLHGRAGHASRPELADNPISRLTNVLTRIAQLHATPSTSHPLLGSPTWTPTMVHSGVIPSMVPGTVELHVDRRMIPGETVAGLQDRLRSVLADAIGEESFEVEVAEEEGVYLPAEIAEDSVAVSHMRSALEANGEEVHLFGTPYSSDVRHLINRAGVEALTFGPGRATEMHARDEFIGIHDLTRAARVVAGFASLALDG
jgi:succinyl-diaminopimelate desuccinylase